MASAYSTLANYGQYVDQSQTIDFLANVASIKQNQYDASKASIQHMVDLFDKIDVVKQEDKDYVSTRLNSLLDILNASGAGKLDLSQSGIQENIEQHISQVLDSNVMNAILGTKKVREFQGQVEWYKKNKPEQYSQVNEMYGLMPVQQWLSDGQAGTSFSGTTYTPYTDVLAKQNKLIKDVRDGNKGQEYDMPMLDANGNPTGRTIKVKYDELTNEQIKSIANQNLSAEDKQQLVINGWFNYGQQGNNVLNDVFTQSIDSQRQYYDNSINIIDTQLSNKSLLSNQRTSLENKKQMLQSARSNLMVSANNASSPQAKMYMLESETMFNGLASVYAYNASKISYGKDDAYWAQVNDNFQREKFEYEKQQDVVTNSINQAKLALEYLKEGLNPDGSKINQSGGIPAGITQSQGLTYGDVEDGNKIAYDAIKEQETLLDSTVSSYMMNEFNDLSENDKKAYYDYREEVKNSNPNISESEITVKALTDTIGLFSGKIPLATTNEILRLSENVKQGKATTYDANVRVNREALANVGAFVASGDSWRSNDAIITDENGQAVVLRDYLQQKGIATESDLKNNPTAARALNGSALASNMVSDIGAMIRTSPTSIVGVPTMLPSVYANGNRQAGNQFKVGKNDINKADTYIGLMLESFGEDSNIASMFTDNGDGYLTFIGDPNAPKTTNAILNAVKGATPTPGLTSYSTDNASFARNASHLSYDALQQRRGQILSEQATYGPSNQVFTINIDTNTSDFNKIINRVQSQYNPKQDIFPVDFNTTKGSRISIQLDPTDSEWTLVWQGDKTEKNNNSTRLARIKTSDVTKDLAWLNSGRVAQYSVERSKPIEQNNIAFADDAKSQSYLGYVNRNFPTTSTSWASKIGATKFLVESFMPLTMQTTMQNGQYVMQNTLSPVGKMVENIIDDPSRFSITARPDKESNQWYLDLYLDGNVIYNMQTRNTNFDSQVESFKMMPQTRLVEMLSGILQLEKIAQVNRREIIYDINNAATDAMRAIRDAYLPATNQQQIP